MSFESFNFLYPTLIENPDESHSGPQNAECGWSFDYGSFLRFVSLNDSTKSCFSLHGSGDLSFKTESFDQMTSVSSYWSRFGALNPAGYLTHGSSDWKLVGLINPSSFR